jgi:hypothetical protein
LCFELLLAVSQEVESGSTQDQSTRNNPNSPSLGVNRNRWLFGDSRLGGNRFGFSHYRLCRSSSRGRLGLGIASSLEASRAAASKQRGGQGANGKSLIHIHLIFPFSLISTLQVFY